jgi:hypothetical protein
VMRAIPRSHHFLVPSSSGLGHHPLKVEARVRIPLGLPFFGTAVCADPDDWKTDGVVVSLASRQAPIGLLIWIALHSYR